MASYVFLFVGTFAIVHLIAGKSRRESIWRRRLQTLGFALATIIWLTFGILRHDITAVAVALVFFTLSISLGGYPSPFIRQASKDPGR